MKKGTLALALAFLAAGGVVFASRRSASAPPASDRPIAKVATTRAPVVVELFSSEGCSSCPSADAYVAALDRAQPIDGVTVIALEENVDYWDRLGWRDPFGSPAFSARQQEYARVLDNHQVFTPEVVFDGQRVMPGGDEDAAREMMQRAAREPKARVTLRRDGARVTVDVTGVAPTRVDDPAEVWLAVTESGLATDVRAGENAGRHLTHAPIVRRLRPLGRVAGGELHADATIDSDPSWKPGALRTVVLVQLAQTMRIVGAAAL